jgi:hypothetical protein
MAEEGDVTDKMKVAIMTALLLSTRQRGPIEDKVREEKGYNDLMVAILEGKAETARKILRDHPEQSGETSKKGATAFYYACEQNEYECIDVLLEVKIDLDAYKAEDWNGFVGALWVGDTVKAEKIYDYAIQIGRQDYVSLSVDTLMDFFNSKKIPEAFGFFVPCSERLQSVRSRHPRDHTTPFGGQKIGQIHCHSSTAKRPISN